MTKANRFGNRSSQDLISLAALIHSKAPVAPNEWGITSGEISGLVQTSGDLTDKVNALVAARAAEKTAMTARDGSRDSLLYVLNSVAATVYANPNVTDEMLSAIGLAPRRANGSRPVAPTAVTDLLAKPSVDGNVRLSWKRGANRPSTVFLIQTSPDDATWTTVRAVTSTRETLSGYEAGEGMWFRVVATNRVGEAAPSAKASIYTPVAPPALRLAA